VATIVAGCMTSHGPNITAKPEITDQQQRVRFVKAMEEARRRLEAVRPDVLVVFSNDHLQNFFYNNMPAFCVGVGERYWAPSEGGAKFLRIPARQIEGARPWGQALVEEALDGGFDVSYSHELEFWDDLSVPLSFLMPESTIPIVPVLINCVAPPLPRPRRVYDLGALIGSFVELIRPAGERVALLGSGGISHWIGVPGHGRINPEFDHRVLDAIQQGRGESLAALTYDEIEQQGGNGGQEVRNWLPVLGALPGRKGHILYDEPVPDWLIGCGVVWMDV
jgi:aromatic ring-opening dioxygenase catalytic subunit (LigB family)